MKTLYLSIIAILVLVISIASNVYAQSSSTGYASLAKISVGLLNMTETNPTIVISGIVYKAFSQNIALTIFNSQNQLISVSQLQPGLDGTFSQNIIPSNPLWPKGNYTVRMTSGSQNLTESIFYFPGIGCCKRIITPGVQGQLSNSTNYLSPLQQFKSGIAAKDVKCNEGLELLLKLHDNMPVCVKSTSIQRLLGQGWINPYNFNGEHTGKESISLSAYQGVSSEAFYNNGTVASNFTINVNINNFKPSNASLVLQVYYDDGTLYKTVTVSSDSIQSDGFYKYPLIAVSDKNHPPPFKVVATYNNETAIAYAPVFAHP